MGTAGCASKETADRLERDNARLRSEVSNLQNIKRDVEGIKHKNKKLAELEELKARRELRVTALTTLAEALALSRAQRTEAEAFYDYLKANKERIARLATQSQSPDQARSVGPYEGYQQYTGSVSQTYAQTLPSAKEKVFALLDIERLHNIDKMQKAIDEIQKELERNFKGVYYWSRYTEKDFGKLPGVKEWYSALKSSANIYEIKDGPIINGATADELQDFASKLK